MCFFFFFRLLVLDERQEVREPRPEPVRRAVRLQTLRDISTTATATTRDSWAPPDWNRRWRRWWRDDLRVGEEIAIKPALILAAVVKPSPGYVVTVE